MKQSQRKPAKKQNQAPLEVEGVQVDIDWGACVLGASFFIPCLDERKLILAVHTRSRANGVKLKSQPRIENGLWGVRFWCVAL